MEPTPAGGHMKARDRFPAVWFVSSTPLRTHNISEPSLAKRHLRHAFERQFRAFRDVYDIKLHNSFSSKTGELKVVTTRTTGLVLEQIAPNTGGPCDYECDFRQRVR